MSLSELQQELKSLKALLLSRQPSYPSTPSPSLPSFAGRPSIPSWQLSDGLNATDSTQPATNGTTLPRSPSVLDSPGPASEASSSSSTVMP